MLRDHPGIERAERFGVEDSVECSACGCLTESPCYIDGEAVCSACYREELENLTGEIMATFANYGIQRDKMDVLELVENLLGVA